MAHAVEYVDRPDVNAGIPAENLLINRPVRLTIEADDNSIMIKHVYRSMNGDVRHGACLALTRASAMALMTRLAEVIQ